MNADKHIVTHGDRAYLNLPIRLLQEKRQSKIGQELIALGVEIKCAFPDSRMKNISPTAVQTLLHCGFNKAKRLLQEAKNYPSLFEYNPKTNSLLAKNMVKPFYSLSKSRKGETMENAICYKLEIKDYSLKELVKLFKFVLTEYTVWAKKVKEEKVAKDALRFKRNKKNNHSFIRTSPISQYSLQKAAGLNNRKAVQRLTKAMEQQGEWSVNRHHLKFAGFYACQTEVMKQKFDPKFMVILPEDGAVCYKQYNDYTLSADGMMRFKHVIFNHRTRLRSRYVKPETEGTKQPTRTEALWNLTTENMTQNICGNPFGEEVVNNCRRMNVAEVLAMIDAHDCETRKYR
ncbi:MAG: hypothetical protein J6K05_06055 [Bacteroidaceae bacterium]|nr:hypothetical protein [Bacteroidaceae bacterium]